MTWTQERTDLAKKLWLDGCSATVIAGELGGVSRSGVLGKVHRLGLPKRRREENNLLGNNQHKRVRPRRQQRGKAATEELRREQSLADLAVAIEATTVVPEAAEPVAFMDARDEHCRWPLGEPQDLTTFRFCGAKRCEGMSYCPTHFRMAYTAPRDRHEAA